MVGSQNVDDMVEDTDDMDEKTESASEFDDEDEDDDEEEPGHSILCSTSEYCPVKVVYGDEGGDTETTIRLDSSGEG